MIVWRLEKEKYKGMAFTGQGAALAPGRWNPRGIPVVYTSATLSLAALEILVHAVSRERLRKVKMVSISAEILEDMPVTRIEIGDLPKNWRTYNPSPHELQVIGAEWLKGGKSAVLSVPSVVVPSEHNYLLNPNHPDFSRIKINTPRSFTFDTRLFK